MNVLLVGFLGALLAANQLRAVTNFVHQSKGPRVELVDTNDPVEIEFKQVMEEDDAAEAEVDQWIQTNQKFAAKGAGEPDADLNRRILARFEKVRQGYESFLSRNSNHARAHLAYAGFLQDIGEDNRAVPHLEKASQLDPGNPAVWNNLANYYGHNGELKLAFEGYTKAIALNTNESIYYQNFGTTVFLFRRDAMDYFGINEQQVFDKALTLYARALALDPKDFPLAADVANTYYGIRPLRTNDALQAWTNAFTLARDDIEREGVRIHLARLNWLVGRTNVAANHLDAVTNEMYTSVKANLVRNLTNAPPDRSTPLSSIPERPPGVPKE